ncbi:MAG: LLM class flavin-dependent oxidoreductase [Nitrososphaerales archaeon]
MRFGLTIAAVEPVAQIARYAQVAEEAGFETIWLSPSGPWFKDSLVYLAAMASQTKKIGLGLMATTPYERNAGTLAAEMLTLNELSDGRAKLAVAIGVEQKLKALGIDPKLPLTAMRETVEVIKSLSTGETVTYQGKVVKLEGLKFPWAKPFPVYVAGSSQRTLEMAGEVSDGAMIAHFPASYTKWAGELMWAAAERKGRNRKDVELLVQAMTVLSQDRDEALKRIKAVKIDPLRPKSFLFFLGPALWASKESKVLERSGFDPQEIQMLEREDEYLKSFESGKGDMSRLDSAIPTSLEEKICKTLAVAGNGDDCLKRVKDWESTGISEFLPGFWGYETRSESTLGGIESFKREIIPQFRNVA